MKRLFFCALLATTWAHSQEGVFLPDARVEPRATVEGSEVVLRYPVVKTPAPKAKGIVLSDSESNAQLAYTPKGIVLMDAGSTAKSACVIHAVLDVPLDERSALAVVLGDTTFSNLRGDQSLKVQKEGAWLSLRVEARQQPAECLRDAGRVFGADEGYVLDLRLSDEERAKPAKVQGQLPEKEITEIGRIVFALAREQILEQLARRPHDGWPELLRNWPGRHALDITLVEGARNRAATVHYAPSAGYQMEQIDGKWTIVGG